MALFMDIHTIEGGVSGSDVAGAHAADLQTQGAHGVNYLRYWVDEQAGKIEVDVTVAQKLSPDQLEEVRQKVSAALKKDAIVHQYVDDSIIGGLILRVQDKLIDASIKTQISKLREQLLAARN